MADFYLKKECRLCNSSNLIKVLPLEPTPLCDAYFKEKVNQAVYPLELFQCIDCSFIQLGCVIDPDIIYKNYVYITKSSIDLNAHFENYTTQVMSDLGLKNDAFIVDIGSNDGTLLKSFLLKGCRVLGVEPAKKIAEYANLQGIETLPDFFDFELAKKIKQKYGSADLVTLNNVFANIDELDSFTKGIEYILSDEGVLIIETSYIVDFAKKMVFDSIYHEHLSYFTVIPLIKFLSKYKLKVFKVERIPTKGGSIRLYCAKASSVRTEDKSVSIAVNDEKKENINADFFNRWMRKIENEKNNLISELDKLDGKKIIGYGASATSTTLIYHFGLQKYFTYLIDDNDIKINTFSPGIHIPVRMIDDVQLDENTVVVILAWRFYEEIFRKLSSFKCAVIVPLPSTYYLKKE